jgi:hypothetical protein
LQYFRITVFPKSHWLKPFQFPAIADFLDLPHDIQFQQQSLDGRAISPSSSGIAGKMKMYITNWAALVALDGLEPRLDMGL